MADKLKEIPGKILKWWNKFTNKQKTIIVAMAAAVIFTFVIIMYTFSRPQYIELGTYESRESAAKIIDILNEAGITHRESADARTVEVLVSQESQANYALGAAGYVPDSLSYSSFVETSMSTTSADRENMYKDYLQKELENAFMMSTPVKKVTVLIERPSQTGTLSSAAQKQEASAYIHVDVTDDFTTANATAMAKAAATFLGNSTTANITILDQNMNILFAGGDDYSPSGPASSMLELQAQAQNTLNNQVRRVLLGTNQFQMIDVASNVVVDFAAYENKIREYSPAEGYDQGMVEQRDTFNSESTSGVEGYPGTDSNGGDLTGYENPDYGSSSSSSQEESVRYQNNVSDSLVSIPAGSIKFDESSISVSMIKIREYYEENVKRQGLLDGGMTWEDFKEANGADIKQEVDEDFYRMVAAASGISEDKISIIAYETPVFHDKEGLSITGTDIASIVLILLILGLLAFVILRSMGPRKKKEEEEELPSLEKLVQATAPEATVEDIDTEAKSEVRKMVEKFVDENPEAAANLLRNWLNEDWN